MRASERTKQLLADGLREMTATTPFRKIRVGELCRRCGVDRRTFYYHFRDVYDLAAWIFDQTIADYPPIADGHFRVDDLAELLEEFLKEQTFYHRGLEEISQNGLGRHIMDRTYLMYQTALCQRKGKDSVTERERFCLVYHSVGSVTMLHRWIVNDRRESAREIARRIYLAMPRMLQELYDDAEEGGNGNEG